MAKSRPYVRGEAHDLQNALSDDLTEVGVIGVARFRCTVLSS